MTERSARSMPVAAAVARRPRTARAPARRCGWRSRRGCRCRHLLMGADGRLAAPAGVALAARYHRGHDHRPVDPPQCIRAGVDDVAADLVAQRERKLVLGAHTVIVVAEVGMADPAAGNLDQHLVRAGGKLVELHLDKGLAPAHHHPTNRLRSSFHLAEFPGAARIWEAPGPSFLDLKQGIPKFRIVIPNSAPCPMARVARAPGWGRDEGGDMAEQLHLGCGGRKWRCRRADGRKSPAGGGKRGRMAGTAYAHGRSPDRGGERRRCCASPRIRSNACLTISTC